ncbi:DUF4342 domain-containing protein [Sphingobacterium sp. LRF_L2]|uniref:DUF4342 domain-containing protein n=1 Tax=Sphingobacterium sp. LRF_L2 TaxID=3369421 RepID=UPI003F619E9F
MKTKTTFNVNSENVTSTFQKVIDSIQETRVVVSAKTGKEYMKLPLLIAILIAIIVPFAVVAAIIIGLALGINLSFEKDVKPADKNDTPSVIHIK